jgi:glucokinase
MGTGVGGGIVVDGRVYRGATGAAAELGHTLIAVAPDDDRVAPGDHFPQPGSLETLASGRALGALARERGFASGEAAVTAAHDGDAAARAVIAVIGHRLGIGVANAINTFDPDLVVIGGGVSAAGELLLAPARAAAARYVLPGVGTATEIRLARYGNEAGVRGAALLAGHEAGVTQRVAA